MKFTVTGANKQTGEDVRIELDAPTPSAAEEQANRLNLMVRSIDAIAAPQIAKDVSESTKDTNNRRVCFGIGCPRCGSGDIKQWRETTGLGAVIILLGIIGLGLTFGGSLIFILIGLAIRRSVAKCKDCKWKWTP